MKKESKKAIYARHGIIYENGKIFHEEFGFINPLMINGNEKIGKGVWHFSTLPTTKEFTANINGKEYIVKGTCAITCAGCYATKGNYRFQSTVDSLAVRTWLVWNDVDFVKRAILAQIEADKIEFCRIHASGDFASVEYIEMWKDIVKACATTTFWTYTKVKEAEKAFDGFQNANIVHSMIPHYGMNFGHFDYIIATYKALKASGEKVYICRCGIDKNQHCTNCKGCSKNEFVLFIEHSTEYKAENDPAFEELKAIIEAQEQS